MTETVNDVRMGTLGGPNLCESSFKNAYIVYVQINQF